MSTNRADIDMWLAQYDSRPGLEERFLSSLPDTTRAQFEATRKMRADFLSDVQVMLLGGDYRASMESASRVTKRASELAHMWSFYIDSVTRFAERELPTSIIVGDW